MAITHPDFQSMSDFKCSVITWSVFFKTEKEMQSLNSIKQGCYWQGGLMGRPDIVEQYKLVEK